MLGCKYPFDVLISAPAQEQSAQQVKGADVRGAFTDGSQSSAVGAANREVYIVNYASAQRWQGGMHLN